MLAARKHRKPPEDQSQLTVDVALPLVRPSHVGLKTYGFRRGHSQEAWGMISVVLLLTQWLKLEVIITSP